MSSLLASLINNFLLLRDLFGYAIPGAVMLVITDYFEQPELSKLPIPNVTWLQAIAAVAASYVVGRVLAAIGYTLLDFRLVPCALDFFTKCITAKHARRQTPPVAVDTNAEKEERSIKASYFRYLYPFMFNEFDRRETLAILHVVLSVGLVFASYFLNAPPPYRAAFLVIGLFMFWNSHWLRGDAENCLKSAVAAAEAAESNDIPTFRWSGGDGDT
jgi:hypothetical protein